ncbi:alpha-N-acetylneuraminate alpha-2,8-sialyltransferase ST8SIA3-like [Diadema antillarum]|uniref:alpha-N-acetylneuraminate alpha-2,8-sialyltransferase ST8SIA3-like n=1 Tax=Diadema antillarum TaxID=105358 RepID=UPI003A8BC7CF
METKSGVSTFPWKRYVAYILVLLVCVCIVLNEQVSKSHQSGPLIAQKESRFRLLFRYPDEKDIGPEVTLVTSRSDDQARESLGQGKPHDYDRTISEESWQAAGGEPRGNERSAANVNDYEESIADIWQEQDDNITWQKYEAEYQSLEWITNERAFQEWRTGLEMYGVDSQKNFLVTHDSVGLKQVLPFYLTREQTYSVSEYFLKLIPKETPYVGPTMGRCAVVGNSGILEKSGCGRAIDSVDYVFRCNVPPLKGYEEDVGLKTNLTTMNPSMLEFDSQGSASLVRHHDEAYNVVLEPYNGVLALPCFSHMFFLRLCFKAIKQYYRENANMTLMHPEHFNTVWDFWKDRGMMSLPSTGFYIVNVAVTLCDKVDLYGFWPFFKTGLSGAAKELRYHYYEDGAWRQTHDMLGEFNRLFQLHKDGALRIHIGKCAR